MKKGILLTAVILAGLVGWAFAEEAAPDRISGTIKIDYLSRYIWRGFDVYARDHSAFQPSIDLNWFGTGFGTEVFYSTAFGNGFVDEQELDFTPYYANSIFDEEIYRISYKLWYTYYSYPKASSNANAMELGGSFAFPNICPWGIVPSYTYIQMWQASSSHSRRAGSCSPSFKGCNGAAHVFGLGYDLVTGAILPNTTEQVFHLGTHLVYNDGVGPGAGAVDHDWSHAVVGVSTDIDLSNNLTFTPGFYIQKSMDDSVNKSDEHWFSLRLAYAF